MPTQVKQVLATTAARSAGPVMKSLPGPHREAVLPGLARLSGIILLAGSVRPSPLTHATGRSPLSLPLANDCTLLDVWRRQALVLAGRAKLDRLPVRIIVDRSSAAPALSSEDVDAGLSVEVDPVELRGTAGVLKDVTAAYADDDYVLTASAAQLMTESLADLATDLAARRSDFIVTAQADESPSSVMLIRCGCLREVSSVGFVDLKEQAIPLIAARHMALVSRRNGRTEHQIRTLSDYVSAVRLHQRNAGKEIADDPFAERWESSAAVIEDGASVDSSATLHDSIVLAGGRVERNVTLVRSVVCAGSVVRRGQVVVDQFVTRQS